MANHNVTTLVKALTTRSTTPRPPCLRRGFPADGDSAAPSPPTSTPRDGQYFTDMEVAAAHQLVLLSESSSDDVLQQAPSRSSASSSSFPSVSNAPLPPPAATMADEDEDDDAEGISAGPGARRRRYRTIRSLYEVTSPIAGRRSTAQGGKKHRT